MVIHRKLLDGPDQQWDARDIEKHLLQITRDHKIEIVSANNRWNLPELFCFPVFKQIISFDDWGVSGHTNHIAINKCLR